MTAIRPAHNLFSADHGTNTPPYSGDTQAIRPRVRIFNVKYSPNLGDGLLSECLEHALVRCGAHNDTWSVDLAGRTAYGPGAAGRGPLIRALHMLPTPMRELAVRLPLAVQSRRRWRPHYDAALPGASCIVIGGGNLIVDLDLNFPTKIALAVEAAERRGLPAFIYGCGVSSGWSRSGRTLMRRALDRRILKKVYIRDERSRLLWNAEFGADFDLPAGVVPDPGLLASWRYGIEGIAPQTNNGRRSIGLNITSPIAVRYHSTQQVETEVLETWYRDLARALVVAGNDVTIFTNGSPEDRSCARRIKADLEADVPADRMAYIEPETPEQLSRLIGSFRGLVAFRMHAVIAAYSCRVPFVALRWDPKLDSFLESVNLEKLLVDPLACSPRSTCGVLETAMSTGIDAEVHAATLAQAIDSVGILKAEMDRAVAETHR